MKWTHSKSYSSRKGPSTDSPARAVDGYANNFYKNFHGGAVSKTSVVGCLNILWYFRALLLRPQPNEEHTSNASTGGDKTINYRSTPAYAMQGRLMR